MTLDCDISRSSHQDSDSSSGLRETPVRLIAAAKRILTEKGYESLTLDRLSAESGINKAATKYYFGNKAGLIKAIVDEIATDQCAYMRSTYSDEQDDPIATFIARITPILNDLDAYACFFDILPHAIRNEELRVRLAAAYDEWYAHNLRRLGWKEEIWLNSSKPVRLGAAGKLIAALADGLAMQMAIYGPEYDTQSVMELFEHILRLLEDERVRQAEAG